MIAITRADLAKPDHARALVRLLDCYAQSPSGGGTGLPERVKHDLVPALRDRHGVHVFLAFHDARAAGLLISMEGFSTFACKPLLNIHDLVVVPEYRGRGIAARLLAACEQLAIEQDCCKLTLEVLEGNATAQRVYTRFGFRPYELDPAMGKSMFWEKKL
ncbi:MAG: GNAT family N-acetyltransferase [Thiogranum sp.]